MELADCRIARQALRPAIRYLPANGVASGGLEPRTRSAPCGIMSHMGSVTANRERLATLRDLLRGNLDFHGATGPRSAHGWHPFPAKFPPQLPARFVERLSAPDDVVLDPMLGSGTTILEAVRLRRRAVGCDIDPLARLITEAKLTRLDPVAMLRLGTSVVDDAKHRFFAEPDKLDASLAQRFDDKTRAFVDYWFLPGQQRELVALLDAIEAQAPQASAPQGVLKFLHMVFSSTIIAKSGGVSLARDLAHTRPHRVLDKQPKCAFDEFAKRLHLVQASHCATDPSGEARILAASADDTGLPARSVDLVVTSPPYANNAIDYMRAHKFSLVWLGWKIGDLTDIRARCLGHEAKTQRVWSDLPEQCERTICRLADADDRKATALRRYFGEMSAVVAEMHRVLKPGKAAVIVVGSSNLRGIDVETHKGIAALGVAAGFQLAHIGARRLDRDRRMMPARWRENGKSQIEQRMHEERVIGLLK